MNRRSPIGLSAAGPARARKQSALRRSAASVYRDGILEAAERVFGRSSFASARMSEIAREAGVGTGTLYNYFDSKELIFSALIERRGDELIGRMEQGYAEHTDPLLRLTVIIRATLEYLEEHRALFLLFTQINGADWGISRVKHAEDRYRSCMALLSRAIGDAVGKKLMRRDIPVEQQALLLSGAMHGVVRAWLASGGETPLVRNTTLVLDFVMNGLGARR